MKKNKITVNFFNFSYKRILLLSIIIVSLFSFAYAAVFVYYNITVNTQGQVPPVIFRPAKNTNQTDLRGTTILVNFDKTNTTATITIHPTYQINFYKNITLIFNQDTSNTYYIKFNVTQKFSNVRITTAILYLRSLDGTTTYATINLLNLGLQPATWTSIGVNGKLRLDLYIVITPQSGDSASSAPFTSDQAKFQLVYSPQNTENP